MTPNAIAHRIVIACGLSLCVPMPAVARDDQAASAGVRRDVVFTAYSPMSRSTELERRLLTPLTLRRARRKLASSGQSLREQSIDLAREKFAVYVPPGAPPSSGYALLVFVPPWKEASVPPGWISALARHHMIFVSAANSGNEADVLDRREPLALLAAWNAMQSYRIDPARVFIGGFSGGSRVALRIALGYPDVFRGALLDAGSDPIGSAEIPLPPAELFQRFQDSTRLVYMTGGRDEFHVHADLESRDSMRHWCVFDIDTETAPHAGHDFADAATVNRALDALLQHEPVDPGKLAACRARIEGELGAEFKQAQDLLASGNSADARAVLEKIDARYGGLAAPRSIELAKKHDMSQ